MGVTQKKSTKIGQTYNCHRTKESFDSSIKANMRDFKNHRKQTKINIFSFFSIIRSRQTTMNLKFSNPSISTADIEVAYLQSAVSSANIHGLKKFKVLVVHLDLTMKNNEKLY